MKQAIDNLMDNVFAYRLFEFEHQVDALADNYGRDKIQKYIEKAYPKVWAWMKGE